MPAIDLKSDFLASGSPWNARSAGTTSPTSSTPRALPAGPRAS
ncbi:acyl-CoA synthetase domain protein [Mycobacterium xenopi 4042]|uniref:Acyl-CoA synthetase domain protein n=1 Tax=Mycobacterium xenopi 4042 TaxID=1299334 RepID=X8AFJ6_MYCXE|nr:acyl-CoA synthetase domain protein [Mycobacterium xenopi 4042]